VDVARTPDERFEGLPGFPYEPVYREWEGLRLAHLDEGQGPPVVLFHGEPTWSYLYRKVMVPLVEAGYRCVVPDLPGFGRSDKPTDQAWYSYDRHTSAMTALFEELDLRGAAIVVQDWGGPIGLRLATAGVPSRIDKIVAMDTGLFTGHQHMGEGWHAFRDFVERTPDLPVGMLVERGCFTPPSADIVAAYDAPFPSVEYKAGARAFPLILPLEPDAPGAAEGRAVAAALREDTRPTLLLWADSDPALPLEPAGRQVQTLFPRARELTVIERAGHFLQEDQGELIGSIVAQWLRDGKQPRR